MSDKDILPPINLIMLPDIDKEDEEILWDYLDILKTCRSSDDFVSFIKLVMDETESRLTKKILIRHIQTYAEMLDK